MASNLIYFSDFFGISPDILESYGAMNISLLNDLPLFIDPFLIFCSEEQECHEMHDEIIKYLVYLRDRSGGLSQPFAAELRYYYCFPEVRQTYLGFCGHGNAGRGLGLDFARALHSGLQGIFSNFGSETITKGNHIEKVCLLKAGVGRDNISDFITNLIKRYLLQYTESFARQYLSPEQCGEFSIEKTIFDYEKGVWLPQRFYLPYVDRDYIILTPVSLLVRDDAWINRKDMICHFERFALSIPDEILRGQVNDYFHSILAKEPKKEERERAAENTIIKFPELIDHYIRHQEDNEHDALCRSLADVYDVKQLFIAQLIELVQQLKQQTNFYNLRATTPYEEAMERVLYLKHVVEECDGYRLFYDGKNPIRRESDLHLMFKLACCNTISSADAEVNNGRGPVDFKFSNGSKEAALVEFKLAKTLKRNLEKQVEIYQAANGNPPAIKVIMFFTDEEHKKVLGILNDLGLTGKPGIVTIDARADKIQASKA